MEDLIKYLIRTQNTPNNENFISEYPDNIWTAINHSHSAIEWKQVTDRIFLANIYKILSCWTKIQPFHFVSVDVLAEYNSTTNFRVMTNMLGSPFIIRCHHTDSANKTVIRLQKIRTRLISERVFGEIDSEPSSWIRNLPSVVDNGKNYFLPEGDSRPPLVENDRPAFLFECFAYAHNVSHYKGTIKELESFAALFGKVQNAVSKFDDDLLSSEDDGLLMIAYGGSIKTCIENIRNVIVNSPEIKSDNITPFYKFISENKVFMSEQINLIEKFINTDKFSSTHLPLLHDVHPHNTFFRGDICMLIYDYQWIGKWSLEELVAFSMHRFIREHLRQRIALGYRAKIEHIKLVSEIFIKNFITSGPAMPDKYLDYLHYYIKIANIRKIYSVIIKLNHLVLDDSKRSYEVLLSELDKFVLFLRESEHFIFDARANLNEPGLQRN